ncbi:hypothetical protein RclHR1_01680004 [Rhizophagus clarus]|uniref:Crinkler effector protein N-terminal domain-containing protein n=1 Tax=Rhizophagus clarus TaxID=94130 RepID=A0A2Z6QIB7_9GLOM|nr:hypothetical protein RclHR1_01680004 [Rhizophagus clarus]
MAQRILYCFILGNALNDIFPVTIGEVTRVNGADIPFKDFTIGYLKDYIIEKKNLASILNIWKVGIIEGSEEWNILKGKPNTEIDIEQELKGNKLDSSMEPIAVSFPESRPKGIAIIVQLPATTVPSRTISQVEVEVQDLLKTYSQELEKVVTNKYDPYVYFKASYDHPYKNEIDEKKIPMLGGNPNLLLYNLPRKNEDCLTNCEHLEADLKRNIVSSSMTVIMGTSGCGKTRLCLELLCRNYSLYFVAVPLSFGAKDLENASTWTENAIRGKKPNEVRKLAERAVWNCITARLVLLNHLFDMAKQLNCVMEPKSWLIFQLSNHLVNDLPVIFVT